MTRSLSLLRRPEFLHLYGGILCTADLANDPIGVYEALLQESPPRLEGHDRRGEAITLTELAALALDVGLTDRAYEEY
ncbi:hypothetical protein [Streptomyces sp. A5-4]|uniref:hypothetical protein n=1 Tax=Streptomyces sp. A5-4 TaxID=3384771 RepID=UPI003DA95428